MIKETAKLLLASLVIPVAVVSQGLKSSIKQCDSEAYDAMEGENRYTCITKSEVMHSDATKDYIEECKITYSRKHEKWSGRLVGRVVNQECTSKTKEPEIIIEYPDDWPQLYHLLHNPARGGAINE